MVTREKNKQVVEPVLGRDAKLILFDWLWPTPQDVWASVTVRTAFIL